MTTTATPGTRARDVFLRGFAPALGRAAVERLLAGVDADDPLLTQGSTTTPPPLQCVMDWPCERACPVGFTHLRANADATVADVEGFFNRTCFEADHLLGEPAACRFFLNWLDDAPRAEMRATLAAWCREFLASTAADAA